MLAKAYELLASGPAFQAPAITKSGGWSVHSPIPTCLWSAGVWLGTHSRHDMGTFNVVCDEERGQWGIDFAGTTGSALCLAKNNFNNTLIPTLLAAFAPKPFNFFRLDNYQVMGTLKTRTVTPTLTSTLTPTLTSTLTEL